VQINPSDITDLQIELGSTSHPYVPYGCVGVDVRSRNLLQTPYYSGANFTNNGVTFTVNEDGTVTANGTATTTANYYIALKSAFTLVAGQTYTLTGTPSGGSNSTYFMVVTDDTTVTYRDHGSGVTFTPTEALVANNYLVRISILSGYTCNNLIFKPQLEAGSTATPYEPYYHQTIPIPLPSRGWVAALPDGTADTLTLDGAGGYVWELNTDEVVLDGSSDEAWQLGASGKRCTIHNTNIAYPPSDNIKLNAFSTAFPAESNSSTFVGTLGFAGGYSYKELHFSDGTGAMVLADWKTYLASNPVTVLYPLATPTTEQGYVDSMPTVPVHAAISSTDLHDLTVRCCADEGAAEIASAWGRKYESRIAALEDAVATLVAAGA